MGRPFVTNLTNILGQLVPWHFVVSRYDLFFTLIHILNVASQVERAIIKWEDGTHVPDADGIGQFSQADWGGEIKKWAETARKMDSSKWTAIMRAVTSCIKAADVARESPGSDKDEDEDEDDPRDAMDVNLPSDDDD